MRSLKDLPLDDLEVALNASDALMLHKQFMPRDGLLVMLVSRFRDDTREAIGMEAERYPGRGNVFCTLDDLTSAELDKVEAAVDTLLEDRFVAVMDDPELPGQLREFQGKLDEQRARARADTGVDGVMTTRVEVTDALIAEWRATNHPYKVVAAEIAEWALKQERGTVLPDNGFFAGDLAIVASASTWKRAKSFLKTWGVLQQGDGPWQVA